MNTLITKIRDHYCRDLINRLNDIETGIRVLVNSPSYVHSQETGFNGVNGRKIIFQDLLNNHNFSHIIETGTYLGDTSAYMAMTSGVQVLTCEKNTSLYSLTKMRLKKIKSVDLYNMDSREFLIELSKNHNITQNECFIYLDAHWGKDLPLKEEISIIASCWKKFVMMIDDFKVPDDKGYVHDSYGTLKYIDMARLKTEYNLCAYFPSMPSSEEPTPPTGCVVLAKNGDYAERLRKTNSLRLYEKI